MLIGLYIWLFRSRDLMTAFCRVRVHRPSLLVAMAISSAVGTLIPLFFKKINIDPAVASGPLITTVNDLVAVVTYYGLELASSSANHASCRLSDLYRRLEVPAAVTRPSVAAHKSIWEGKKRFFPLPLLIFPLNLREQFPARSPEHSF